MNCWEKLGEIVIDRVVLVVLAAVLLGGIEYRYANLQRASDARAAVSTVMTDALIQQRRSLTSAVEDYMLAIERMVENNSSDPALPRAERQIRLASSFFAAVSSNDAVDENANTLESNMVRLSNYVRGDRPGGDTNESNVAVQQRLQDQFIESYVRFTSDIRSVTLEALELESTDQ